MSMEKLRIRMDGLNLLTIENCGAEEVATINVPTSPAPDGEEVSKVSEGVRRVLSEYRETLRKLSNE